MALSISQTFALSKILKPGMKVSSMGYPDIIAPPEMLEFLFGTRMNHVEMREDSSDICKRHGLKERAIPDAVALFKMLDCELQVYDIVQERGCEILCDLNRPREFIHVSEYSPYDIVLDVGTAEHCFNIAQALINMAGLVKKGGHIIHENPFNWGNHGFYNFNPTLFADFYAANGFTLLECHLVGRDGEARVPHTERFRFTGQEVNVFALAQRVEVKAFVFPVQSKYANLIPAAGVDRAREVVNG